MNKPIITALASYGMSGEVFHAPLLMSNPNFKLTSVLERHHNRSQKRYPKITVVKNYDDLLKNPDIELIIVNTPDHLHAEMAEQALWAGKHVVVEKPFTISSQKAEKLCEIADQQKCVLSVFQNRRWDSDFLTIQKVMQSEVLGRIVEFESHFDRYRNFIKPDTWKEDADSGTGTIYNLGSHLIDQALVLFGMPRAVNAELRTLRSGGQVDDSIDIRLSYQDVKVSLKASYLSREKLPRFTIHGTAGSFLKYGFDPQEEALKNAFMPNDPNWGQEPPDIWGLLNSDVNGLHLVGEVESLAGNYPAYYENIYAAIRQDDPLAVTAQQATSVIRIIEAAKQSSQEERSIKL